MDDGNDAKTTPTAPRGSLSRVLVVVLVIFAAGLGGAVYFIAQPQDLSDLRSDSPESGPALPVDVKSLLQNALDHSYPVKFTQSEINRWLRSTLETKQGGRLADHVSMDGVWVRLEDGRAEVVLERKVMGHPFTVSMYLQVEQSESEDGPTSHVQFHGGEFHPYLPYPKCGGRFGRLAVPQGFLHLVLPAFKSLAAVFPEELRLGFSEIPRVKFADDTLTFDPRGPQPPAISPPNP